MRKPFIFLPVLTLVACYGGALSNIRLGDGTHYVNHSQSAQWVTLPDESHIKLTSGTSIVLGANFALGNRVVDIDGEGMFEVHPWAGKMFVVTTKNLLIVGPGTKFRVDAFRTRPGEEVDLVQGRLTIRKSYHSDLDSAAEILDSGDMLMINREIDLMEKERMNPDESEKVKGRF